MELDLKELSDCVDSIEQHIEDAGGSVGVFVHVNNLRPVLVACRGILDTAMASSDGSSEDAPQTIDLHLHLTPDHEVKKVGNLLTVVSIYEERRREEKRREEARGRSDCNGGSNPT